MNSCSVEQVDMRPAGRTALDTEGDEIAERKSLLRRKQQQQVFPMIDFGR